MIKIICFEIWKWWDLPLQHSYSHFVLCQPATAYCCWNMSASHWHRKIITWLRTESWWPHPMLSYVLIHFVLRFLNLKKFHKDSHRAHQLQVNMNDYVWVRVPGSTFCSCVWLHSGFVLFSFISQQRKMPSVIVQTILSYVPGLTSIRMKINYSCLTEISVHMDCVAIAEPQHIRTEGPDDCSWILDVILLWLLY